MSQHATYLGQRLFISKVIARTCTQTHTRTERTDCSTWTTKPLVTCRTDRDRMQLQVEADELGNELEQLAKAKVS